MLVLIFISIVAFLCSLLYSMGKWKNGLFACFLILTIIEALHYDVGNDYMQYLSLFNDYASYNSFTDIIELDVARNGEWGWGFLNWLFSKLFGNVGFFVLIAALAVLKNFIYYSFIKTHVEKKWVWLSAFVFIFTSSFYLVGFSGLRQWTVIAMFVWAYTFIERKKIIPALLIVLLGTVIHSSSMILLPFVFWGYLPVGKAMGRVVSIILISIFVLVLFFRDTVESFFQIALLYEGLESYDTYFDSGESLHLGLGFLINMIPLVLSIIYLNSRNNTSLDNEKRLVSLASIGIILMPIGAVVPLATRLTTYFSIFSIASYPIIYKAVKEPLLKSFFIFLLFFMTYLSYSGFFTSITYAKAFQTYKTIFSVL